MSALRAPGRGGAGAGRFEFIGSTGAKVLTDGTLPAGVASATYKITAVRSTARGHAALFTVKFGVGHVSVGAEGGGVKIAA